MGETPQIIDISPSITTRTAVWPGDQAFKKAEQLKLADGASINLNSFTTTPHIGAHADAPLHYQDGTASIGEVDLRDYIGPCRVVQVAPTDRLIKVSDLPKDLQESPKVERILFRTDSSKNPEIFNEDFTTFAAETIEHLGRHGVRLIGIDTPSVDPFHSKDLPSHHMLLKYHMRNLEGLALTHVAPGNYELIALPLKLMGMDASPVRAVLRKM
jgi:arylformamidase